MADLVPAGRACYGEGKTVAVEHFTVDTVPVRGWMHPSEYVEPGRYARLMVNGGVMMSDVANEQRTNLSVTIHAKEDALIAAVLWLNEERQRWVAAEIERLKRQPFSYPPKV